MKYTPIKYDIHGAELWAVEDNYGNILKYCNSKEDATEACEIEEKEGSQHLEEPKKSDQLVEVEKR